MMDLIPHFPLIVLISLLMVNGEETKTSIMSTILNKASAWDELESGVSFAKPVLGLTPSPKQRTVKGGLVKFLLYTNDINHSDELIYGDVDSLKQSRFNWKNPVKFFVHGFGQNGYRPFPQAVKTAYIEEGYDLNLIAVDWGALSANSSSLNALEAFQQYLKAVANVPIVGERVGDFIGFLIQNGYTSLDKVHIVGFSLGAQIAGQAGYRVQQILNGKVARVTGLDPAGPLFRTGKVGRPLSPTDGQYVDTVHTDMGQSGTLLDLGQANYYVNGGMPPQPGCLAAIFKSATFSDMLPLALSGSCSHNKAPDYWALSIRKKLNLQARQCTGYRDYENGQCMRGGLADFGERSEPGTTGELYIDLNAPDPILIT